MSPARAAAGAAAGALAVVAALRLLERRPPAGRERWERTNHAGRTVTLLEGPAVALAAAAASAAAGRGPAALATVCAGSLGLLDDLAGSAASRGLRGHLGALRAGQVTTGAVKTVGLVATGLVVVAAQDGSCRPVAWPAGAGVVAGTANLVNLLDLRPGRALKATLLAGAPLLAGGGAAEGVLAGVCLGALPPDLAGRSMLGDTGANALGALLGTLVVARCGTAARCAVLAAATAATLASERVSFSAVIDARPLLRRIDRWGRAGA